jgi:hypothetical protein
MRRSTNRFVLTFPGADDMVQLLVSLYTRVQWRLISFLANQRPILLPKTSFQSANVPLLLFEGLLMHCSGRRNTGFPETNLVGVTECEYPRVAAYC